jgi:prepilin-type N-terminal cleavage/methylation domain-containing protein
MSARGFTLVEVLIVASITILITGALVTNFSRSRVDLNQVVIVLLDAVREAQASALSGSLVRGTYRCGYGIHFTADGFIIYAGPDSGLLDCSAQNRNYELGTDSVVRTAVLPNNALEIVLPAPDIFFEPPNPITYIGNSSAPGASANINVRRKGGQCPSSDCRTIHVTTSGQIQAQ